VTEEDVRRDGLLKAAGISVVRFHVREIPSVDRLREVFVEDSSGAAKA